jgi:uncharacterized Zn-finger protein
MPEAPVAQQAALETIHADSRTVACDGGCGPLGHPRVYLYIEDQSVVCPYCSRVFVLNAGADHGAGH